MTLPAAFLTRPIAHRALHDIANGRPENSRAAISAAIERGYGIEIDLQLSKDGHAMVFHDYDLARLSNGVGPIQMQTVDELAQLQLTGSSESIPTFEEVLKLVSGRVPLLIELKDQDGAMGPNVGPLEDTACAALAGYDGPAAVMSFNPYSVAHCATLAPDLPRGLVSCDYNAQDWPTLPEPRRAALAQIPDFNALDCNFISHDRRSLGMARVSDIKALGHPILTWTIRSLEQEALAREIADNITFEGYLA